ncbi:MAG TPA: class I SAM-dependent methyltransferase [Candidatus Nanoarchaeia archaeon]|nr:class I SAM-dependent methyltransferase [Candidatus Nanoarchaeia archaeon]
MPSTKNSIKNSMEYYNSISQGYEELHGEEQRRKLTIVRQHLRVKGSELLLDVGCGTGITTQFSSRTVGIDPAIRLLKKARIRSRVNGVAEHLPFKDSAFDIIVSITAIQNFQDIEEGLKEILRVGKDRFALSFLKKSVKREDIESGINRLFRVTEIIEEEKDVIIFCDKRRVIT